MEFRIMLSIWFLKKQNKKKTTPCWLFLTEEIKHCKSSAIGVLFFCFLLCGMLPSCHKWKAWQTLAGMKSPYFMTTSQVWSNVKTSHDVCPHLHLYLGRKVGCYIQLLTRILSAINSLTWIWHKSVSWMYLAGLFHDYHGHLDQI